MAASTARSAASFEQYRASVEAAARRAAPAGSQVTVGSTYASKDGKLLFSDANVVSKRADTIGFQIGRKSLVFRRAELDEVPGTFIETRPAGGRSASFIRGCVDPDTCPPAPDPTDPPNPTPPAAQTSYLSVSSASASTIAAQRTGPCTQTFTTNGYPGATMTYSAASVNTWALRYRPGYPYYLGFDTEYKTVAVSLVDGTTQQVINSYTVATDATTESDLIYTGSLSMVKIARISILDYAVDAINTIVGTANVTCASDARLPVTTIVPTVSAPTDPPGSGWNVQPPPIVGPA